jgi:hypothetical protein
MSQDTTLAWLEDKEMLTTLHAIKNVIIFYTLQSMATVLKSDY